MSYFIDVAFDKLNKYGEELCGDTVNVIPLEDYTIIVLADGLGSGVKANILSTLTSKIAGTMLKEGANIYETVDTIVNTLPVCKTREVAYSTFSIIKIYNDGSVYTAEYDNPPFFVIVNNKSIKIPKRDIIINGKKVKEGNFNLSEGDSITVVSDGVIHAGLGNILNLGWSWENVENYLERSIFDKPTAQSICKDLLSVTWDLYGGMPGDDATVLSVKLRIPEYINIFTGPPKEKEKDSYVIKELINSQGKKIICGGTAANIAERELRRPLHVNLDCFSSDLPPTASMEGIDLITEGVLTLSKTVDKLKKYREYLSKPGEIYTLDGNDGASQLARMLINNCTHLNIWMGDAVNPAHQNPDFPSDLSIKKKIVKELCYILKKLGKHITIHNV